MLQCAPQPAEFLHILESTVLLPDCLSPSMLSYCLLWWKWQMLPKDIHVLMSWCGYVALPGKGDFTDANALKISSREDHPGISGWSWCDQKGLVRGGRQEVRGERSCCVLGLKMEEGALSQRCRQPLEAGKARKWIHPWRLQKEPAQLTPWVEPHKALFRISLCCFKPQTL